MNIDFCKYQGTGNDFILIDNRSNIFANISSAQINLLCDRRFGIGADGLILLNSHSNYDFEMHYFNSDGKEASMCGNGGRCIVSFAKKIGIINNSTKFIAVDGTHQAEVDEFENVKLKMQNVNKIEFGKNYYYLDTGSPHYVCFVKNIENFDVYKKGFKIRHNKRFREKGTNVDFVEIMENSIFVRTYERGVENETLSCGTGVIASAISFSLLSKLNNNEYFITTKGGDLKVFLNKNKNRTFDNIWIEGPAKLVFTGNIKI
ncbi:MAG: diaminopimelate epimerase [Bacteroidetes bacterium]|nr:MAG: diaminopimelate epimerase [Bacteroidota bacterium]